MTGHIEVVQSEGGPTQIIVRGDVSIRPKIEFVNGVPIAVGHTVQDADGYTVELNPHDQMVGTRAKRVN